jgi:tryptophanyl-tRNA synthetase
MKEQMQLKELARMEKLALVDEPTTTTTANNNVPNTTENNTDDDMVVTAFEVSGSIDYTKLIEKFGSKPLTPYLLRRLENVTVKRGTVPRLHRFLRREIFFSHRDIEKICELLEGWYGVSPPSPDEAEDDVEGSAQAQQQEQPTTPCPIYLYTGRGPSSAAMHLGHLVPFLFTAWLQKAFQCPLVIQMTDDEKFIFKGEYIGDDSGDAGGNQTVDGGGGDATNNEGAADDNRTGDNLDYFAKLTIENAKDIIACDFIYDKTFLFSDLEYVGKMYPNIVRIWKAVTINQVNGIFGFDGTSNIGKAAFPAIQAAPSFGSSFPVVLGGRDTVNAATLACLIPCAIDQDPYFRLTRDVAHKLVPRRHPLRGKPALIHSKFFPPLQGAKGKMSSSDPNSAIFLTDTDQEIERKIKVHAFSGGRETKVLQMELGANLDVDVSYQWLRFFLEDDDELARIGHEYGTGSGEFWSTGSVKAKLVQVLKELVKEHQDRRDKVTDEVVRKWMSERCILGREGNEGIANGARGEFGRRC